MFLEKGKIQGSYRLVLPVLHFNLMQMIKRTGIYKI